jgi:hypothetical protein
MIGRRGDPGLSFAGVLAFCWLFSCATALSQEVTIWPQAVVIDGPRGSQQLVAQAKFPDGHEEDLTRRAAFSSSDRAVAEVDSSGRVRSVADGVAVVTARVADRSATVKVTVRGSGRPYVPSFANNVLPVMTKAGCNSGACHGAAAGKNGFKLTLRGYDPEVDYQVLTRQALGRRVNRLEPARSLMLLKPTLALPHGGGKRFETTSREYEVLSSWIAAGAPPLSDGDATLRELEVFPKSATLQPGAEQQVLVTARFSDGHAEDVTRWAIFNSSDAAVAAVQEDGRVKMQGRGEAAVTVYYLSRVAAARLSVPFDNVLTAGAYRGFRPENFIDELVLAKLQSLRIPVSQSSSDAEFVRRAYLDAIGTLPRADEVTHFLDDPNPDKRARLADRLLERLEYASYWSYKWSDVLLVSSRKLQPRSMRAYYQFVRDSVAANKPFDRFAYEILTASGNSAENGAVNYFLVQKNPIDLAENTTQAFLGMRLTCARCHNHPLEKWTQKDYYGFTNLFTRVGLKNNPGGDVTVFSTAAGDILHPRLLRPMPPRPLDGEAMPLDSPEDRRVRLARWLTSKDNPFFARVTVNRIWKSFMGRGLVEAVDDVRSTNPASNEDLLAALTRYFVENNFDCKQLIRAIMRSAAYQLSSRTLPENAADERYYSHYIVRRLPAEVILDAVSQVTGVPQDFPGYPPGTRALDLPDSRVESYFLTVFGRPERVIPCDCERQQDPSLQQALHLINGDTVNQKIINLGGITESYLKLGMSAPMILDHLYLSTLARLPAAAEKKEILTVFREAEAQPVTATRNPKREFIEDVIWAVISGREFLFNH